MSLLCYTVADMSNAIYLQIQVIILCKATAQLQECPMFIIYSVYIHSTESTDYRMGRGFQHLSNCLRYDIYLLYTTQQTSQAFLQCLPYLLVIGRSLELRQSCRYHRCSTLLCRRSDVSGLRVSGQPAFSARCGGRRIASV